jgi:alanyl-tRNA synthetase
VKTLRLHYDDPTKLDFEATVLAHDEHAGRPSVVLDQTAFYAEAGGQMADRGRLGDVVLVDVQADDAGRVHHVLDAGLDGEPPAIGASVRGAVDGPRRRQHMALHTGQHMLSRAVLDLFGAVTLSSRLGESACTIDVDRSGLSLENLRDAEDRVNAAIDQDRPVRQWFASDAELEAASLRKPPLDTDRVRLIDIEGFDVTPCGGTHCTHTAQVGLVWIERVERYKGGTRITFSAGPRARTELRSRTEMLAGAASVLGVSPLEVVHGAGRLLDKVRLTEQSLVEARSRAAELRAESLPIHDGRIVAWLDEGTPPAVLRSVAERCRARGASIVALAAPDGGEANALVAVDAAAGWDAGRVFRAITADVGGRGGGRPPLAQGRLPGGTDWEAVVDRALRETGP